MTKVLYFIRDESLESYFVSSITPIVEGGRVISYRILDPLEINRSYRIYRDWTHE